jgi:hypothetical protein
MTAINQKWKIIMHYSGKEEINEQKKKGMWQLYIGIN